MTEFLAFLKFSLLHIASVLLCAAAIYLVCTSRHERIELFTIKIFPHFQLF